MSVKRFLDFVVLILFIFPSNFPLQVVKNFREVWTAKANKWPTCLCCWCLGCFYRWLLQFLSLLKKTGYGELVTLLWCISSSICFSGYCRYAYCQIFSDACSGFIWIFTLSRHTSILQSLHIFPTTCNKTAFFKVGSTINYSYFLSKKFNNERRAGINLECLIRQIHSFSDVAARTFDNKKVSWEL